jgi:HAD superfamily hydrolase (TIGR01509 family)
MFKAVFFDMDGVLIDSESHWERQQKDFLLPMVREFTVRHSREVQGLSNLSFYHYLKTECGLIPDQVEFMQKLGQFADGLYENDVQLMPGVLQLLQDVKKAGLICYVVSSSPLRHIRKVVDRFDLKHYFSNLISAEMVGGIGKPDPAVYRLAVESSGQNPDHCVALEDSGHGICSAKKAGIRVFAVRSEQNPDQNLSAADAVFTGFGEELQQALFTRP